MIYFWNTEHSINRWMTIFLCVLCMTDHAMYRYFSFLGERIFKYNSYDLKKKYIIIKTWQALSINSGMKSYILHYCLEEINVIFKVVCFAIFGNISRVYNNKCYWSISSNVILYLNLYINDFLIILVF